MAQTNSIAPTPLATFVRGRLAELEISQSDFCRRSTFDQGLLSKIQNSLVTSLSIESVLKLAVGLSVPPQQLFRLIDRSDLHELVMRSYAQEFSTVVSGWLQNQAPELAVEVRRVITEASDALQSGGCRTRRRRWLREGFNGGLGGARQAETPREEAETSANDRNGVHGGEVERPAESNLRMS